jgi:hypothetical protein
MEFETKEMQPDTTAQAVAESMKKPIGPEEIKKFMKDNRVAEKIERGVPLYSE